jgi:hypothetical protein
MLYFLGTATVKLQIRQIDFDDFPIVKRNCFSHSSLNALNPTSLSLFLSDASCLLKAILTSHLKEINWEYVVRNTPTKWQLILYCCASLALTLFTRYNKIKTSEEIYWGKNH